MSGHCEICYLNLMNWANVRQISVIVYDNYICILCILVLLSYSSNMESK
jgi:hypothetical protein